MSAASVQHTRSAVRPLWLVLVALLFVAGQTAATSHWHDLKASVHYQHCPLCVLGAASGSAVTAQEVRPELAIATPAPICRHSTGTRRVAERFHEARAPPRFPISTV